MADSRLPYGPNTVPVRRFLQRLAAFDTAAELQIVTHYDGLAPTPAYRAAELALGMAVTRSGREAERDALAGPFLQLVRLPADDAAAEPDDAAPVFRAVAEPALAALLAVLMQDVLQPAEFTALYAPFAAAIPADSLN